MNLFYSARAMSDLLDIGRYTLETWGEVQASHYLDQIEDRCLILTKSPYLGRLRATSHPGLRRMKHGSHIIFYRQNADGITITHILHHRMLPDQQSLDEPETT